MNHHLFDLTGKTALITGASSGLGRRFALTLSEAGAKVILAARRLDYLQDLASEIQAKGRVAVPAKIDITDKYSVHSTIDWLVKQGHKIDILVNSAGIALRTSILEIDTKQDFESVIQTNIMGVWYTTQEVANHMKNNKIAGTIINISSISGSNTPALDASAYSVSKAAVLHMTKQLVGSLAPYNIRINAIVPGIFHTNMTEKMIASYGEEIIKNTPLGFIAIPEDMDGLLLLLASNNASRYITGAAITIDGGVSWGGFYPSRQDDE